MNKQTIEYAIAFLNRTELKGSEVPYFNEIMSELEKEYNKKDPVEELEEDNEEIQDEDQEHFDEGPEEEITDKKIQKKKTELKDLMSEVDSL